MIDLSVLICSTHTRWQTFGRSIQEQIWGQYAQLAPGFQSSIEILMLTDNKAMPLGYKRNVLLDAAQGTYVAFVDDDDRIEPDYLVSLVDAARSDADVITFLVSVSLNGGTPKICRYSREFQKDRNLPTGYERLPNHICAVKTALASQARFHNPLSFGEDADYAKKLHPLLSTEHHIPRVLYHYDYSNETTETRQTPLRPVPVRPPTPQPVVDVVILSKGDTARMRKMTQTTIDTCLKGAKGLPVNVIVMEQTNARYAHAQTVHIPPMVPFNYNEFANVGAEKGSAEWIMVANNDLVFTPGWLHALLAAKHPLVSPKNPNHRLQRHHQKNVTGYTVTEHLSGWCFMVSRKLWDLIGGFDESVRFWASDDMLVEQVRAVGVEPMLVPGATVRHTVSETLKSSPERDELTWGQLHIFIEKFGKHRLMNHPDYLRWKRENTK